MIGRRIDTAAIDELGDDARSEQPFVVRFDRADGVDDARFANVGHINEPVRERNRVPYQ